MFNTRLHAPQARPPGPHPRQIGLRKGRRRAPARRARIASSSDCERVAAVPRVVPSDADEFSAAPVMDCRVGSRLSSKAAIFDWSNVRSCFGFGGCGGAALASGFGTGFLVSSDFKASAIGSTLGGSGFFSIAFGSSLGLLSATGFGGSGFFSTGFSTGFGGGGGGAVSVTTGAFSAILPTVSSTGGLASATFSTSGLGFSFL